MTRTELNEPVEQSVTAQRGFLATARQFIARHERVVDIFGLVFFWAGIAVYAGWITLPNIPFLTDAQIMYLGIGFNAVWWGFLRPRIDKLRREAKSLGEDARD